MKWGVPSYAKGTFNIIALKNHVNLGFSMKGLSKEEQERFEGSGKTMKTNRISSIKKINEDRLVELLKLWCTKENRNTKWVMESNGYSSIEGALKR